MTFSYPCSFSTVLYTSHRIPPVQYIMMGLSFGISANGPILSSTFVSTVSRNDSWTGLCAPLKCPTSHSYPFLTSNSKGFSLSVGSSFAFSIISCHSSGDKLVPRFDVSAIGKCAVPFSNCTNCGFTLKRRSGCPCSW